MKSLRSSFLESSRWDDADAAAEAVRGLAWQVSQTRGFALFFAVCDQPKTRDQLIGMLRRFAPCCDMRLLELSQNTTDVINELARHEPDLSGPVQIVNIEQAVRLDYDRHEVLATLNLQRARWRHQVAQPVVFWVPRYVLSCLERQAPDFFHSRRDTVRFPDLADDQILTLREFLGLTAEQGLLPESRLGRVQELQSRLEQHAASEDRAVRAASAAWRSELAHHLAQLGQDLSHSLLLLKQALHTYDELGDERSQAATLGEMARIRVDRSEWDAALRLQEERLAILGELRDREGIANTLWSIAQVELEQQRFHEAFEHLAAAYGMVIKLGRLEAICWIGLDLGLLLCARGQRHEGRAILARSRDGFLKLGQTELARDTDAVLARYSLLPWRASQMFRKCTGFP